MGEKEIEKRLSSIKWLGRSSGVMHGIAKALKSKDTSLQYGLSFKGESLVVSNDINHIVDLVCLARKNLDILSSDIDIFVDTKVNMRKTIKEYKDYSWEDYPSNLLEANKKRMVNRVIQRFKNKFIKDKVHE
jgi:hypothetical protein